MITDFKENLPVIIKKFDSKKDKREIIKILKSLASDDNIVAILNFRENMSGGFYFDVITEHVGYIHQTPTIDRYIITFNKEKNSVERARELTLKWLRIITKILNKNKNLYPIDNFSKKTLAKSIDRPESYLYPFDDFRIGYIELTYLREISGIDELVNIDPITKFPQKITVSKFIYRCMNINYTGKILIMSDTLEDNDMITQRIRDHLTSLGRYDILIGGC